MELIIQKYLENVTKIVEKEITLSSISDKIKSASQEFAIETLKTILENINEEIKNSKERKRKWHIERHDKRIISTSLGKLEFTRTYYVNKHKKKEYAYLLDQALAINKYERIDASVEAKLLKYANELSYEKAGKMFDDNLSLSKETVKNKVLKFGKTEVEIEEPKEKKKVKYLYIDADEDHISLQSGKNKINKLIYVYDGKLKESKRRNILLNKKVFGSVSKSNDELWLEVLDYIDSRYDYDSLEKIYIQGDGANWIKAGVSWIDKSIHIIDMFHLNKEIMKLAGGNLKEGLGFELKKLIYKKQKDKFIEKSKEILENELDEKRREKKKKAVGYIKNQWKGIEEFIDHKKQRKLGCSAEGHVSHIMSSRFSSRPKGWSLEGLESMTKLRISIENGISVKEIKESLKRKNKEIAIERKEKLKHIKRIKKKVGETLGNIAAIKLGHKNRTYNGIKGLTRYKEKWS